MIINKELVNKIEKALLVKQEALEQISKTALLFKEYSEASNKSKALNKEANLLGNTVFADLNYPFVIEYNGKIYRRQKVEDVTYSYGDGALKECEISKLVIEEPVENVNESIV